jgi:hypothetical protein
MAMVDVVLMVIVPGTMMLAIVIDIAAVVGWLRLRWGSL